ncbi:MAG: hypothetical protein RMY34_20685 [Aulosira sp. DedQUE10]|nr:hypothetical protein [Aulosira sp. DedQUE10]
MTITLTMKEDRELWEEATKVAHNHPSNAQTTESLGDISTKQHKPALID